MSWSHWDAIMLASEELELEDWMVGLLLIRRTYGKITINIDEFAHDFIVVKTELEADPSDEDQHDAIAEIEQHGWRLTRGEWYMTYT